VPRSTEAFVLPTFLRGSRMKELDDPVHAAGYDPAAATGEIILNENLARILDVAPGDEVRLSLSPASLTNELVFRVNGITAPDFESPQEKTVYLHLGELQLVTGKHERDAVDFIGIKLDGEVGGDAVAARLAQEYPVEAFTNDDLVREVGVLTSTFEGFAQMVGIVTLAVALLFVSTVMMLVVNERTAELGALRAIGFTQSRVFRLVLAEAAILVAIASLIGFGLGYLGAIGFDTFLREMNAERTPASFHFTRLSWGLLLRVSGLTALLALVAGLLPAWRASRLDVLTALRSV
jgi:putative ABC transport system permease protein